MIRPSLSVHDRLRLLQFAERLLADKANPDAADIHGVESMALDTTAPARTPAEIAAKLEWAWDLDGGDLFCAGTARASILEDLRRLA